ncbi:MAG: type II toxin-antitoxin system VapC family toxin [Actinomycetota bacterium]
MSECLDSWAVLEWLKDAEPAASRVQKALKKRPVMSWVNLGEVFYIVARREGEPAAAEVIRALTPQLRLDLPTRQRVLEAAKIKSGFTVAYADAFAIATATAHDAILLTGDDEILSANSAWPTEDIR